MLELIILQTLLLFSSLDEIIQVLFSDYLFSNVMAITDPI